MPTDTPGFYSGPNAGWRCPGCHRCYAPAVTECPRCGGGDLLPGGGPVVRPKGPPLLPPRPATPPGEKVFQPFPAD